MHRCQEASRSRSNCLQSLDEHVGVVEAEHGVVVDEELVSARLSVRIPVLDEIDDIVELYVLEYDTLDIFQGMAEEEDAQSA